MFIYCFPKRYKETAAIRKSRFHKAKGRSTSEKIYEIAAKVGYLKTSYFIKVFKDRYGITPQEFRDR
ncbi:helix-turn-helix domain-containing protein [Paenibacillus sp. LPE1-1-1.1]|uniref:helix-turn-helix domain-containing protein n=1 Tax=Paenibacillus sp. LPE1-1-1.1 TaxID=3135230 RepID=UPI003419B6AF